MLSGFSFQRWRQEQWRSLLASDLDLIELQQLNDLNYDLCASSGRRLIQIAHVSRLKSYLNPQSPLTSVPAVPTDQWESWTVVDYGELPEGAVVPELEHDEDNDEPPLPPLSTQPLVHNDIIDMKSSMTSSDHHRAAQESPVDTYWHVPDVPIQGLLEEIHSASVPLPITARSIPVDSSTKPSNPTTRCLAIDTNRCLMTSTGADKWSKVACSTTSSSTAIQASDSCCSWQEMWMWVWWPLWIYLQWW